MTPRVLGRELEAARMRAVDRFREHTTQAWQTVRFNAAYRSKKGLQPLSSYLDEMEKGARGLPPPQSPIEAAAALEIIAAQWGLKMRKVKR